MPKSIKLNTRTIAEIYSGLVRLLESGHKPVEALRRLGLEKDAWTTFATTAAEAIEEGSNMAEALEKGAPDAFPDRDLAMLEAAEMTNTYSDTLRRLVADHERRSAVIGRFAKRILYPALLVHVAALVCVYFLVYTDATLWAAGGLVVALVPFYTLLLFGWSLHNRFWAGPESRDTFQTFPFIMSIVRDSELGNFFRLVYTLYGAGIRLDEAARRSASLIRTGSIRKTVVAALEPLDKNEPFSACLEAIGLPDHSFVTRISIGEETGNLEEALKETGEELADRAQQKASTQLKRITVIITILAYVAAGMVIIGHWTNYFDELNSTFESMR